MRTVTIVKNLYSFEELSDEAKVFALDSNRHINTEDIEWYDGDIEHFRESSAMIGLDIEKVIFSGFCCQGDGASIEGKYEYKAGAVKNLEAFIKQHNLPEDSIYHKLLDVASVLQDMQKRYFYSINISMKNNGHYAHSGEMSIQFDYDYDLCGDRNTCNDEDEALRLFRRLADHMYKELDSSYYSLISDDAVKEAILESEVEFLENGKPATIEQQAA